MKTVLHIAGHMGQGIGKVLSGVACYKYGEFRHDIILLGDEIDTQFSNRCLSEGIDVRYTTDINYIRKAVSDADIVQLDWWHYPPLCKVMSEIQDIKMRLIIWSHVSGCYFPYHSRKLVELPYKFIFTSQYSYENPYWEHGIPDNTCLVNSSGGFPNTQDVPLKEHNGFNIGYLGTLKYIKLHPRFIDFCKEVSHLPGVKFIMMGVIPEPNLILLEAKQAGIDHLFEFTGYIPDVSTELSRIDVMGYLLNPYSYVTSENAMLEGMSMGIPPVCLNQGAEKYLIKDKVSGFLIKDKSEYRAVIERLYDNLSVRKVAGLNARHHVLQNLNIQNTVSKLDIEYSGVMKKPKQIFDFGSAIGRTPLGWYFSGIPPCGINEVVEHLYDASKSSLQQWEKYFPRMAEY